MFRRRCDIANKVWINEEIKATEVRVIDENGEQLGIMQREEALDIAEEKGLDLVNVSPNAKPPVCKILDYGKFKYDQQKREKEARKKQKTIFFGRNGYLPYREKDSDPRAPCGTCGKIIAASWRKRTEASFSVYQTQQPGHEGGYVPARRVAVQGFDDGGQHQPAM